MSQLKELMQRYDRLLRQSIGDHAAVLQLVSEFRKSTLDLKNSPREINEELSSMINKMDKKRLDLLLIAASANPSPEYVENLCALLEMQDQTLPNEQIVDLLYVIRSPKAVPYLEKARLLKLPHDEYDEFAVKCLDALAVIDTTEGWAAVQAAAASSSPRIKEHAKELLGWRKLG